MFSYYLDVIIMGFYNDLVLNHLNIFSKLILKDLKYLILMGQIY
jgi:hypothetical protein